MRASQIRIKRILGQRLLVIPASPGRVSTSGLICFHPRYLDDQKHWTVLMIGDGVKDIRPGDRIIYDPGLGCDLAFEDEWGGRIIKADLAQMRLRAADAVEHE